MTNTAIVIRDYSTIDGGGHAVAHVATCGKIQGLAVADPGVFLTDRRFFGHLVLVGNGNQLDHVRLASVA